MDLPNNVNGLQHVGIPTNRLEETVAFFEGLGFTSVREDINRTTGSRVVFLECKSLIIETWEEAQICKKAGAIEHIAFDVSDIEKAFSDIKGSGYRLLDTEIRFLPFWENGVRFFTIEGPNGEKIEFCQKL